MAFSNGKYPYTLFTRKAGIDSSSVEKEKTAMYKTWVEAAICQISKLTKVILEYISNQKEVYPVQQFSIIPKAFKQRQGQTFFAQAHFEHEFSAKWTPQAMLNTAEVPTLPRSPYRGIGGKLKLYQTLPQYQHY